MEHIIKIKVDDRYKVGKDLLAFLSSFAKSTKAISVVHETTEEAEDETKKITLDELIDAVDEEPLLGQLKAYREKGTTDLRAIAKELGFTREDKEDLALLVMMKKNATGKYVSREAIMEKLRAPVK